MSALEVCDRLSGARSAIETVIVALNGIETESSITRHAVDTLALVSAVIEEATDALGRADGMERAA